MMKFVPKQNKVYQTIYRIGPFRQGDCIEWHNNTKKIMLIRKGIPYETIEFVGQEMDLTTTRMLQLLDVKQSTYNRKKKENALLSCKDTEIVLFLKELCDFGIEVFNNETDKFQRWIKEKNIALGSITPESLFDSITGINEVRNELNRIEYGVFA